MIKCVILAGGKGTRLKPFTQVFPKPLVPIGEMPILEVVIRQLVAAGLTDITLAVNHMHKLIMTFFGDGEALGAKIDYSIEDKVLGTAGPIRLVKDIKKYDDVLVINGDLLMNVDFKKMVQKHQKGGQCFTIGVFEKQVKIDLGVVHLGEDDRINGFEEKPMLNYNVSTGVNLLSSRVIKEIPENQRYDIPDLVLKLIDQGEVVKGHRIEGKWMDIGRVEDYELALEEFANNRQVYLPE